MVIKALTVLKAAKIIRLVRVELSFNLTFGYVRCFRSVSVLDSNLINVEDIE